VVFRRTTVNKSATGVYIEVHDLAGLLSVVPYQRRFIPTPKSKEARDRLRASLLEKMEEIGVYIRRDIG